MIIFMLTALNAYCAIVTTILCIKFDIEDGNGENEITNWEVFALPVLMFFLWWVLLGLMIAAEVKAFKEQNKP